MSYYLDGPAKGKAQHLSDAYDAVRVTEGEARERVAAGGEDGVHVVVIVENSTFEAAGVAYDMREFERFVRPGDFRPRTFMVMDRAKAAELSGCRS
jgi:hypothetical protein